MFVVISSIIMSVLFLSVILYSVGKYRHRNKNSTTRRPGLQNMRRWGHNDGELAKNYCWTWIALLSVHTRLTVNHMWSEVNKSRSIITHRIEIHSDMRDKKTSHLSMILRGVKYIFHNLFDLIPVVIELSWARSQDQSQWKWFSSLIRFLCIWRLSYCRVSCCGWSWWVFLWWILSASWITFRFPCSIELRRIVVV